MSIVKDLKYQYNTGNIALKIIFWNVFLYVIPEVVFAVLKLFAINIPYLSYISLSSSWQHLASMPWTIVTYAFFHNGAMHLLFNMLMLHFVSNWFVSFFTQKQLFAVYVLGSIFSGFIYILGYQYLPALLGVGTTYLVGASAGIMALLFAVTTYQPYLEIKSIFGTVRLWHIAFVFIFLDLVQASVSNTGGHLSHMGGALFGFIFAKSLINGTDITSFFNKAIDKIVTLFKKDNAVPFKKVHVNYHKKAAPKSAPKNKIIIKNKEQQQIDEILEKISKSGYDSLTKEEKEFLFKAGK